MRSRNERGLSESVQWAVLTPLLLLLLLGALQVGMMWHGRNTALHAASAAADAESLHRAAPGSGQRAAETIARAGGLTDITVVVARGADQVDVEVTGAVPVLIDLGLARVTQRASAPTERAR